MEMLDELRMKTWIATSNNGTAVLSGTAVPCAHNASSSLNDGDERLNVVGLKTGLDDCIYEARGEHAVGVTVAPVSRQPCFLRDCVEGCALLGCLEHVGRRGHEGRRGQAFA